MPATLFESVGHLRIDYSKTYLQIRTAIVANQHRCRSSQEATFSRPPSGGILARVRRQGAPAKTVQKSRRRSAGEFGFTRYLSSEIGLSALFSKKTFGLLGFYETVQKSVKRMQFASHLGELS